MKLFNLVYVLFVFIRYIEAKLKKNRKEKESCFVIIIRVASFLNIVKFI